MRQPPASSDNRRFRLWIYYGLCLSDCPDVECIPGKVSGAWLVEGTRLPVEAILANGYEYTPEGIAAEIFRGLTPEVADRSSGAALSDHEVATAFEMGWNTLGFGNGELLAAAGFDAMITDDQNLIYQ
jgi:hypothetical protein